MEKKAALAVALSILVMFFYSFIIARFYPKVRTYKVSDQVSERPGLKPAPGPGLTGLTGLKPEPEEISLEFEPRKDILENERLKIILNSIGGSIEGIFFKEKGTDGQPIIKDALFAKGLLSIDSPLIKEGSYLDYEIKKINGTEILSKEIEGLRIEKRVSLLEGKPGILAEVIFKNLNEAPINFFYKINLGTHFSESASRKGFFEIVTFAQEKVSRFSSYNIRNFKEIHQKDIEWFGARERFYSLITKPQDVPSSHLEILREGSIFTIFLKTGDLTLLPGQTTIHRYILYAGPNSLNELRDFGYGFDKSLSFGMFSSIAQILLTILNLFYKIFKNYGVAVILLSLSINLFLFPLTLKSIKSMRQLQEIQPHINRLREEFKNNPQRLNKELMELYKRYRVNPFGGCLPMLLQMPIFFALYQALMHSAELRLQRFLWIKDLSGPDTFFRLNFKIPILGDSLNLLPILMLFAMFIQQRLSTFGTVSEQTEQQKILSVMMPVMFGVMFYNLPSGLVLYWLTSTIISSALQFAVIRKKS